MSQAIVHYLMWDTQTEKYQVSEIKRQKLIALPINPVGTQWCAWLENICAFTFQSKNGSRFLVRKEMRAHQGAAWYAYRHINGKLIRKYIGSCHELSLAQLEHMARDFLHLEESTSSTSNQSRQILHQLLSTKFFIPTTSHALIERPHLHALLDRWQRYPLTLISAAAGFGKTSMLSRWVHSLPTGNPLVAWISLDELDDSPFQFWAYVFTALDNCQEGLCTALLNTLNDQRQLPLESLLQYLINILVGSTKQFLLILDDYHVITEPTIHASLSYLIEHLPPQLRVIISTQSDPPLPLSRLRSHNQVLEIRTEQLRCSKEETLLFLQQVMRVTLTDQELEEVERRVEGWIAGLQLTTLSLQEPVTPDALLSLLRGKQRFILDYLIDEVLQRQNPAMQHFLLRTSILDYLTPELCDAILERHGSLHDLQELERANIFLVPEDASNNSYRYHALFAQALYAHMENRCKEEIPALCLRASQWYAKHQYFYEAIRYALRAQAWQWAANLIEHVPHGLIWGQCEYVPLQQWLQRLPDDVVRTHPRLCLAYAQALFRDAQPSTTERWLRDGKAVILHSSSSQNEAQSMQENILGEIEALQALVSSHYFGNGQKTLSLCNEALNHLSPQNVEVRAQVAAAQSLAAFSSGDILTATQQMREASLLAQTAGAASSAVVYMGRVALNLIMLGKLHGAWQWAQQAIDDANRLHKTSLTIVDWPYLYQAELLREWNRLEEARDLALKAVCFGEQTETTTFLQMAYAILLKIYLSQGAFDAARVVKQQLEQAMMKAFTPYRRAMYTLVEETRFWLECGELEHALHWANCLDQEEVVASPLAQERQKVAQVRILLAQHQTEQALHLLPPLIKQAEITHRWNHVLEMLLLQSLALQMDQQRQKALTTLAQAVQIAEPEGYIRRFVDEGAPMGDLLSTLQSQQSSNGPTPYLDTLLAAFPSQMSTGKRTDGRIRLDKGQPPLVDPLSAREMEVLQLLAQGASNQEIAVALVITIETVKRHISNIFAKLGVTNRTQAVVHSYTLGLLPQGQ